MIYADLEFYQNEFLLGRKEVIPFSEFEYWSRKASQYIDLHTFNRLWEYEEQIDIDSLNFPGATQNVNGNVPYEVKMATCEIAEVYFNNAQASDISAKRSETVGNYSVSYVDPTDVTSGLTSTLRNVLVRWLGNTGLLFRG